MADETVTVLLKVEGDTSDAQQELGKLQATEKKTGAAAKEMGKTHDGVFKSIRDGAGWARKAFGEVSGTIAAVRGAYQLLGAAGDAYAAKHKDQAKAWNESKRAWSTALSSIQESIGMLVVKLGPLSKAIAEIVGGVAALVSMADKLPQLPSVSLGGTSSWLSGLISRGVSAVKAGDGDINQGVLKQTGLYDAVRDNQAAEMLAATMLPLVQKYITAKGPSKRSGGGGIEVYDSYWKPYEAPSPIFGMGHDFWGDEAARLAASNGGTGTGIGAANDLRGSMGFPDASMIASGAAGLMARSNSERGETLMSRMFGSLEEFDAYREAFSGIADVATSAFDAMADGSMSVGEAIKQSIAASLKSLGSRMLIRALEETAEGFAALAWGPIGGASAAAHFKSAGLFGAGAAAAGLASRALGGQGSAAAASGGGANLGRGTGGSTGGGNTTVILGDYFSDDNPRARAGKVARAVRSARKEIDNSSGVRFS